ncbi:expressed unknown protein [Seminavis robusta]|uniref:Uncharacterized protein n=1 Tax=Seminavis robusta TaxID=568900 RepID=A0A9N8DVW0_9STRA|nr:expressed unknown protein [Seminavis robusta]|eukprot:Sro382_g131190.1 n/a (606) ;mRNA; r:65998-67815
MSSQQGTDSAADGGVATGSSSSNEGPISFNEASERLAEIFNDFFTDHVGQDPPQYPREEVLKLLRNHNALLYDRFENVDSEHQRLTISYLMEGQSDLQTIQEILQWTESLGDPVHEEIAFEALCDACRFGCQPGVMEFLVNASISYGLDMVGRLLQTPAQIVLHDDLSVARTDDEKIHILQLLVDADETAVLGTYGDWHDLIKQALRGDFGTPIMQFLVHAYANSQDKDGAMLCIDDDSMTIGLPQAEALAVLLRKIYSFTCEPGGWDRQGFARLMDALGSNESIGILFIELPLPFFRDANNRVGGSLRQAIAGNNTIYSATFRGSREEFGDDCLRAVLAGLTGNSSMKDTTICRFSLSVSQPLTEFMAHCRVPMLRLEHISFQEDANHDFAFFDDCYIQKLHLTNDLGDEWCNQLICRLDSIPSLWHLCLIHEGGDPSDVTLPLMTSIGRKGYQGKLLKLVLCNTVIDLDAFSVILRNNNQLEDLNIHACNTSNYCALLGCVAEHLEHHSTKLTCVYTSYSGWNADDVEIPKELNKVDFFLALNRYGRRKKAMTDGTTLPEFVGLLCDIITRPRVERGGGDCHHNLQFGLLRITPHLWSSSADT